MKASWERVLGSQARKSLGRVLFWEESALTVDVMMSFPVQLGLTRGNTSGLQLPRMKAFVKRMEERPAYKRAIEKVGPLEILS